MVIKLTRQAKSKKERDLSLKSLERERFLGSEIKTRLKRSCSLSLVSVYP